MEKKDRNARMRERERDKESYCLCVSLVVVAAPNVWPIVPMNEGISMDQQRWRIPESMHSPPNNNIDHTSSFHRCCMNRLHRIALHCIAFAFARLLERHVSDESDVEWMWPN